MNPMNRALALARRALGSVSPNPAVGAVLVRDGEVVGEGWTQPPGQAHAEAGALRQAGERARGATLYTTLEPCPHYGRTPPCAKAIIEAGIAEVHAAMIDPNPLVAGRGMEMLAERGIATNIGDGEHEARQIVEAYAKFITTGLPFVTAKYAMSLDGKTATYTGESRWISGEESRQFVHRLRAESDAVMVGIGTVLADDPRLTVRDGDTGVATRQPLRVVVDSRLRTPESARVLTEPGRVVLASATGKDEPADPWKGLDVGVEAVPSGDGSVDLAELLRRLGARDVTSVLVEGGGMLLGSLFDNRLVDKVVAFIAPSIIGGKAARSPVEGTGAGRIADTLHLDRVEVRRFGADTAVIGYLT